MKYFCNISRKNFVTKLIFGMLINITVFLKLILSLLMGLANHAQSTQASLHYICDISKQKLGTEFIFCRQVNIRVFMDVQSSQNNQFPLSLKCHARVSRFLVCTQTAQPYPKYLQCHTQSIYNDKCNISRTGCQIVITSYIQIDLTSFELVPLVGMLMYVQICPMYCSSIYTIELQQFHHTLKYSYVVLSYPCAVCRSMSILFSYTGLSSYTLQRFNLVSLRFTCNILLFLLS